MQHAKGSTRKQRKRMLEGDDPHDDLRMRLELFIEKPSDHGRLLSLIGGLVDLELSARLSEVLPPA
ncbi:hypothetical protein [Cupriavidus metallidurans]|uniref:Uncharacterized protein n=1 Tax=Cupriavidus metallidurans (strain ATCC 43123 / DSM 2839 / NBRC 102507 / CH34) TaxID=266264 RepID=D3DXX2_CUPMC|nr:hypothetical protein [Cupriavidus metallidurans]ADC45142.1 hypothetical protein Rmet_6535 [Cupriavidus metallidurans CH34]QGS29706.1 hypothetical protein FOB83_12880 [Cupriavidus metallidurans]